MKIRVQTAAVVALSGALALPEGCATPKTDVQPDSAPAAIASAPSTDRDAASGSSGDWTIPGLAGAHVVGLRSKDSARNTRAHSRELTPPDDESRTSLAGDVPNLPGWRFVENTVRIWEFTYDGRPYAYVTYVTLGAREVNSGETVALASMTYYEYRDDDGDGRFETRRNTMGPVVDPPRWAK